MANKSYTVIIKTSLESKAIKSGQREINSAFDQIAQSAEKSAKRESDAFTRSANTRLVAEQKAAREVERINQQTTRNADREERIRERTARTLAAEKTRLIKREQDEFLKAEAVKTAAVQKAAQAQIAAAERSKASMIAAWGAVKVAALAAFAAIVTAVGGLGVAISRAMSFDVLERSLEVVAGTAQEAAKQLVRLKELARLPGLGLRQAIEASIALQIGFQSSIKNTATRLELAEKTIQQFSNAIALTGGGPEIFQRVITQLGQMSNAGKVLMSDLRPIIQAAPALGLSLQRAFGTISPEEINALGLSSEEFMRRWIAALETLKRAPETAANAWTNFTVAFDLALVKIGKSFLEPLTRGLSALEPLLETVGTKISEVFTMLGQDAAKLWADLPASTKAAFADMLATVTGVGGQIVEWFKTNYPQIQEAVTNVLNQIAEFWEKHGDTIKKNLQVTLEQLDRILQVGLSVLKGDWKAAGENFVGVLKSNGSRLLAITEQNMNLIQDAIRKAVPIVGKIAYGIGTAIAEGVWEGIKNSNVADRIKVWAVEMALAAKSKLEMRSPSQVFMRIGAGIGEGLALGIESKNGRVLQTLADMLDLTAGKFTKGPKKPVEAAAKQIATALRQQATALRELTKQDTELNKINRLLSDPAVAKRIDERTAALLRQSAALRATRERRALEDVGALTRERRVGFDVEGDILGLGRDRRTLEDVGGLTRPRFADEAARKNQDTLFDEAVRRAEEMRERIRDVAFDISDVFANAVEDWSGSFGNFFRHIGSGFSQLLRRMVSDVVHSGLSQVFKGLLSSVMGGGSTNSTGGGGILGSIKQFFGGGGGFSGGGSSDLGGGSIFTPGGTGATRPRILGGISVPGSSSQSQNTIQQIAAIAQGNPASTTGAGVQAPGIMSTMTASLPLLGAAYGASTWVDILSGKGVSTFQAITGGGIIGYFINRSIQRRKEEKLRNQASLDTLPAVMALHKEAYSGNLTVLEAKSQFDAIRSAYFQSIAGIKDSKTRRHAETWWSRDVEAYYWPKIEAAARTASEKRAAAAIFESAFVPTFAGGGLVPFSGGLSTLIKVRPGERIDDVGLMRSWTVPGRDTGRDSVLTMASPGSAVRTRSQQSIPGFANGSGSAPSGDIVIKANDATAALLKVALDGVRSADGQKIIVQTVRSNIDREGADGLAGDFELALRRR